MTSRRTAWQAGGLVAAGAVAGGVLAAAVAASASSPGAGQPSPGYPAGYAAGPGGGPGNGGAPGYGGPGRAGHIGLPLSGTVASVGSGSVTIATSSGTKPYTVDANSDIDKNGEAALSDLKSGDKVRFAVRPGTSTIAVLHAGDEAKDRPAFGAGPMGGRGFGGPGHAGAMRLPLTGTVTLVGSGSVTIQTSSGTKPYAVDGNSDIDKNGEAALSDLKSGDKVRFAVRPGTSTIAVLHAGDEAKDRPAMRGGGPMHDAPPPAGVTPPTTNG